MKVDYSKIGPGYIYCFNAKCPQSDTCVRFLVGSQSPDDKQVGTAVFPAAFRDKECRFFQEIRIVTFAYGFEHLYDDVRRVHYTEIRKKLTAFLGNKGQYYKYMHGEKGLSPRQQQVFREVFEQYGYSEDLLFDHYEQQYEY